MTGPEKSYKIWVNNLVKTADESELKAEKYARHLKYTQL